MSSNQSNQTNKPIARLSESDLEDLQFVAQQELPSDTRKALEENFPPEQLPIWEVFDEYLRQGFVLLHELRSKTTGELLSSRVTVDYAVRNRTEVEFLLVSFFVTPDNKGTPGSKQSKSKGYGSYLRERSLEVTRYQKPHAIGIVAERESVKDVTTEGDQRFRRARWMSRMGLFIVHDYEHLIPPISHTADKSAPVATRSGQTKRAELLLFRFDGKRTLSGRILRSIVERLYTIGYLIPNEDPFILERISAIDEDKDYDLVDA
jgi:hypothetical protein